MEDHPVGEADADLADGHRLRRGLLGNFDESGGKSIGQRRLFVGIGVGAVLTGVLAELLIVQTLVLAELADGPPVTVILVLAQRCCRGLAFLGHQRFSSSLTLTQ